MNRIVEWFVHNPIAANLLMVMILLGGVNSIFSINKQFFPSENTNQVIVSLAYPGASPAEVEKQICVRIEEAVHDLNGIEEINSVAREGVGTVTIKVESGYDSQRLLNEVKSRVDAINTFPVEAERPQITESLFQVRIVSLALAGDIGEANLKELGAQLRDEIASLPGIQLVDLREPRDYEVSIEVSELALRRYGLRFDDVVNAVRNSSLNLPAGKLRTVDGDIQLQTRGQGYVAADFETIILLSKNDGTRVLLGDVANVVDGFAEQDVYARFNDKPSLALNVYVTGDPNVLKTSEVVRDYVDAVQSRLPEGVELLAWRDMSDAYRDRMGTLVSNGLGGLLLVFVVLMFFLRPLLAFWVCAGIAVAFLGTIWILPATGAALDMITMFSFILILGIVVDDAIIVGESVHTHQQGGLKGAQGAIVGTQVVLKPVWFAVMSTMVFFVPYFFLPGDWNGPTMIPRVVLVALTFSLIESMFILPAHLAHMRPESDSNWRFPGAARLEGIRHRTATAMTDFAANRYRPFLETCMAWKGLTITIFVMALLVTSSFWFGGWLQTSFFPRVPVDFIRANVTLPEGSPFEDVVATMEQVENAAIELKRDINGELSFIGNIESVSNTNGVMVTVELTNTDQRGQSNQELKEMWQEAIGVIPLAEEFDISFTMIPISKPIVFELSSPRVEDITAVTTELRQLLARYDGVHNVRDTLDRPRPEIELRLKPEAEFLDITLADLARQVRRGFYGEEVQRIPRTREDVKVMVRYPDAERNSEDYLRNMRIRTPSGREVPFETVAEVVYVPGYQQIKRIDRKRVSTVSADLSPGYASAGAISASILRENRARWLQQYPGFEITMKGEQSDQAEFVGAMAWLMLMALVVIYGMMAIAFRSYFQPILVLVSIPFGLMGAIIGHVMLGIEISMFSLLGIIACAGVVVNDNLVLIDKINRLREQSLSLQKAIAEAAQDRFRPIMLTSITTFIGLTPIMLETSVQAKFLIPMVVSLAFGVLLATLVTLIFVPVLYLKLVRIKTGVNSAITAS